MDAEGYLKSHGWRGLGYSLDQKDRGLKKPLLVSKKIDVLGVGKQRHQAQADQWWMRAFDESLKQIGTGQKVCHKTRCFLIMSSTIHCLHSNGRLSSRERDTGCRCEAVTR